MGFYGIIFLLGRILYGGYFLLSGINHFTKIKSFSEYAGSKGVPLPRLTTAISGILIFLGGLGILLGIYVEWAILAIVLFLVPVSFIMHAFWSETDQGMKMVDEQMFMKNMALLGAALLVLFLQSPWLYSLGLPY